MKKVLISTLVLGSLVAATAQDASVNAFGNAYVIDPSVKVRAGLTRNWFVVVCKCFGFRQSDVI